MAKSKETAQASSEQTPSLFSASIKAIDPALASLFASSAGPAQPRVNTSRPAPTKAAVRNTPSIGVEAAETNNSSESGSDASRSFSRDVVTFEDIERPRKRRRVEVDDLEASYFTRLAREEQREQLQHETVEGINGANVDTSSDASSASEGSDDAHMTDVQDALPRHEALDKTEMENAAEKEKRTVFLSNVSVDAIKSKTSRKTLINHLESVLDSGTEKKLSSKVESLRFRSTAFVSDAGPKKAAYAKKELMDQTMKSTNAYAVFTTEWAARKAASVLNSSVVLDRHLRVDHLAQPSKVDHRRCVFIGNLSFVDEETTEEKTGDGQSKPHRPKAKEPADAEEGLWRAFGKVGKVESVRVIRDKETRVSKGFAYVQFADQNGVEAALLLNEKKFPPMLPRKLRVMRAKRTTERLHGGVRRKPVSSSVNRAGKDRQWPGRPQTIDRNTRSGVNQLAKAANFVFEGHRASKGAPRKEVKEKKRKHAIKPTTRSSRRGAAFKAAGGKRQRESKQ